MRTNKFSIDGLIGVYVSSIVFKVIRTISIFLRKTFELKKALKRKTNDFHPFRSFFACKRLLPLLFFCSLLFILLIFAFHVFFLRSNVFRKKGISWLKIVLITSNTILLWIIFSYNWGSAPRKKSVQASAKSTNSGHGKRQLFQRKSSIMPGFDSNIKTDNSDEYFQSKLGRSLPGSLIRVNLVNWT